MKTNAWVRLLPIAVVLGVALPAAAYRYPLSSTAIRDAYFQGTSNRAQGHLLAEYTPAPPEFSSALYRSSVEIETPYIQDAERARAAYNYTAEDAEEVFLARPPALLYVHVRIRRGHAELRSPEVTVIQAGTQLMPSSVEHWPYYAYSRHGRGPAIGEHVDLEFRADKITSSPLTIQIKTADNQHAETTFDLGKLRQDLRRVSNWAPGVTPSPWPLRTCWNWALLCGL
jgi:hypothetical protein